MNQSIYIGLDYLNDFENKSILSNPKRIFFENRSKKILTFTCLENLKNFIKIAECFRKEILLKKVKLINLNLFFRLY